MQGKASDREGLQGSETSKRKLESLTLNKAEPGLSHRLDSPPS